MAQIGMTADHLRPLAQQLFRSTHTDFAIVAEMESEQIEAAWQKVLQDWDEDDAHKRFIVLCESFNVLHEAGSRYRSIRESDPERSERAKKQIDRILASAMSKLSIERSEPQKRPPRACLLYTSPSPRD